MFIIYNFVNWYESDQIFALGPRQKSTWPDTWYLATLWYLKTVAYIPHVIYGYVNLLMHCCIFVGFSWPFCCGGGVSFWLYKVDLTKTFWLDTALYCNREEWKIWKSQLRTKNQWEGIQKSGGDIFRIVQYVRSSLLWVGFDRSILRGEKPRRGYLGKIQVQTGLYSILFSFYTYLIDRR